MRARLALEKEAAEEVADAEEDEDHRGDDPGDEAIIDSSSRAGALGLRLHRLESSHRRRAARAGAST